MKKRELERKLKDLGWWFKRHGSNHDIWTNGDISVSIPRHNEIREKLSEKIIRKALLNPKKESQNVI